MSAETKWDNPLSHYYDACQDLVGIFLFPELAATNNLPRKHPKWVKSPHVWDIWVDGGGKWVYTNILWGMIPAIGIALHSSGDEVNHAWVLDA
jgi:hypothetical protein